MTTNIIERKSKGYEKMNGTSADDTYIINDISKTWKEINDPNADGYHYDEEDADEVIDYGNNVDTDHMIIKNTSADEIMLLFDVFKNGRDTYIDEEGDINIIDDGLTIIRKSNLDSVINAAMADKNPTAGGIDIPYYFGTTNNFNEDGTPIANPQFGKDYMATITLVEKNGVERLLDVPASIEGIKTNVIEFLNGTKFNSVYECIEEGTKTQRDALLKIFKDAKLVTTLAPDSINIENNGKLIDLTNVSLPGFVSHTCNGAVVDEGLGPELGCDKSGNNLVIRYNGEWQERTYTEVDGTEVEISEYVNYKTYTIPNYFKTNGKSDIKVKVNVCNPENGDIIEAGKIFDLKEIATVSIAKSEIKKNQTITGTFLRDEIDGGEGKDTIYGNSGNDIIYGNSGNDLIKGGNGDDHIWGDSGNDKLYGEAGKNRLYFNAGDGNDTIYSGKGEDTIVFETMNNADNISVATKGNSLIINYGENEVKDSITLDNYFKNRGAHSVKTIELPNAESENTTYSVEDIIARTQIKKNGVEDKKNSKLYGTFLNDVITGGNLDDTIKASQGNDTIIGGKGNDKLYGEYGNNTFKFTNGDGNDIIYSSKGSDTLEFTNTAFNTSDDIEIEKKGNSLVLKYGENDSVELSNYLKNKTNSVKTIIDSEGRKYSLEELLSSKDFTVKVEGNLTKKNTLTGTKFNNLIVGGNAADTIKGNNGDDYITGSKGNDKLYGYEGNNKFYFSKGDGNDTIYLGKGNDTIVFDEGISKDDIVLTTSGKNLIIKYSEDDSITISNYLKNSNTASVKTMQIAGEELSIADLISKQGYEYALKINKGKEIEGSEINGGRLNDSIIGSKGNDTINGGRGHDTIKGGNGDDLIIGGCGNDKLYGEAGNNTFIFNTGDAKDTVYMGKGTDTLTFNKSSIENIHYEKSGNHLAIKYGENDTVSVNNYFSSKYKSVDKITDAAGNSISLNNDVITKGKYDTAIDIWGDGDSDYFISGYHYEGNNYNNLIVANNKKLNFVEAGAGDDMIYCQGKQVIANGGTGSDTYIVSSLKNATSIEDESGDNDIIRIAEKSSNVNLFFDVQKDETIMNDENGMMIINKSTLSTFIKTRNIESVKSGIEISEFFDEKGNLGSGAIERIETTNGYVSLNQINELKSNVASWLAANDFSSSMTALEEGTKTQVNELLAIYQNIDWQPLN